MKPSLLPFTAAALLLAPLHPAAIHATENTGTTRSESPAPVLAVPFAHLGAEAQKQYSGDGIAITPTAEGARLRVIFQKLEGHATAEGLWLSSTVDEPGRAPERFRVKAVAVGREKTGQAPSLPVQGAQPEALRQLPSTGVVRTEKEAALWQRPGLVEEYRVSMDGVRQDFVVAQRPPGVGALHVALEVSGAVAQAESYGAKLSLNGSGREIAYSRLHVTDATGRELFACIEAPAPDRLRVVVDDAGAVYPVRVDPTFSDANWVSLNPGAPGANDVIYALAVDSGGNLVIGGDFTFVGTVGARRVAKWDGSSWSPLGAGVNDSVWALAVIGTDLYAAGSFTMAGGAPAGYIAKWDGSSWSPLGPGLNLPANALAVDGTDLYVAGSFTMAGGAPALRVAKWDGLAWTALGAGMDEQVHSLAVNGGTLYAGGVFSTAGGMAASRIAKWDGLFWTPLGSGMNGAVFSLVINGGTLYAGGAFTTAGGSPASYIAKWDGMGWAALGSGMNNSVLALAYSSGELYAGGAFTTAGGTAASHVAVWNGAVWSALAGGVDGSVNALLVSGGGLVAGGAFTKADGVTANYLAAWDDSAWSAFGSGMNDGVLALAVSGSTLYAGGLFTTAGGVAASHIAQWDGTKWSALGSGTNMPVHALAVENGTLYAGGSFTMAGGAAANRIAKWDGSAWSPLGTGMDDTVLALALDNGTLYAGGDFTSAGGVADTKFIAQWNGASWAPLETGMDNSVCTLLVEGGALYAGGSFTLAGTTPADRIAQWSSGSWHALGAGADDKVRALAYNDGVLYAGGDFSTAGGVLSSHIAKWNGFGWVAMGAGTNGSVHALAVSGRNLFVGGSFTTADGMSARRIAIWDGSSWSAFGTGMNNNIHALAAGVSGDLYAGGLFKFAGTTLSPFVAAANLLMSRHCVGDAVNLDLSVIPLGAGESLRVLGLPSGLIFIPGLFPTISGTVYGPAGNKSVQIQVRSGSKVLRTFVYDLAVEPFKTAGSYELLLEEAGLPVGKLKVTVASPTKRSPNPAYTATLERLGEPRRIARGSFLATASPQTITLVFPTFRTIYPAVTYDLLVTTGMETVTAATNPASAQTGRGFRLALASQTPGGNQSLTLSLAPAVPGNRVSTPGGIGHATGFARSNGQVRLRGLLGDGQVFSATLLLSSTKQAVLWLTPYRDKMSYLGGIVTIGDLAVPERSETAGAEEAGLKWKREPDPRAKSYPNGFGPLDLSALASRWYAMRSAEALAQSLGLEFRIFEVRYVAPTMDVLPARWSLRDNYTLLPVFPPQAVTFNGRATARNGSFLGTLRLPFPATRSQVRGVLLQDAAFGELTGQGLVKIRITGPGLVSGSFQTMGIELEN